MGWYAVALGLGLFIGLVFSALTSSKEIDLNQFSYRVTVGFIGLASVILGCTLQITSALSQQVSDHRHSAAKKLSLSLRISRYPLQA
jgi:hypothetical protein